VKMPRPLHRWDLSTEEAVRLQQRLAAKVELKPLPTKIRLVAGADMALSKEEGLFFAAVVVLRYPELEPVEERAARAEARFPYVPGLLSFREAPVVLDAVSKLQSEPDVLICDGQGVAHPRRIGLASHLGLWLRMPTIGCAKSLLVGEHEAPGRKSGSWKPLKDGREVIGSVLRTRSNVKPVFVSPGHKCDHEGAREVVLGCVDRFRLPEPTRRAHLAVKRVKEVYLERLA